MEVLGREYEQKRRFVSEELTAMLYTATGAFVRECAYDASFGVEMVNVYVGADPKHVTVVPVNVTTFSLWAIAKALIEEVTKRY